MNHRYFTRKILISHRVKYEQFAALKLRKDAKLRGLCGRVLHANTMHIDIPDA